MTDNKPELPSEIGGSTEQSSESTAVDQNTTQTQGGSESEQELSLDELNPSGTPKVSVKSQAEKQVDKWMAKVIDQETGEIRQDQMDKLESTPNLHWIKKRIDKELNIEEAPKESVNFQAEIEAYEERKSFNANKKVVESLPVELRNKVIRYAKKLSTELKADVMKSLEYSMKEFDEEISSSSETLQTRKQGQKIPKTRTRLDKRTYTRAEMAMMTQDEFDRVKDLADKGEITII